MKKLLLLSLMLCGIAAAQCPGPYWEGVQCTPAYWQCFEDESCYFLGGWASVIRIDCYGYDPSIGQDNSCSQYVGECTNYCGGFSSTFNSTRLAAFMQKHPNTLISCPRKPLKRSVPIDQELALAFWKVLWRQH